jgi:Kef-type K+ transport system membrane component KefB
MFAAAPDRILEALKEVSLEAFLLPLLIQLALIIAAARLFAWLFRRIGQPAVVGEIAAGLILGPSVLGRLLPGLFDAVFHPPIAGLPSEAADLLLNRTLQVLAQIGLVLLLFLIGMEFDFGHLRWHGKSALSISLMGVIAPFGLGLLLGWWMHPVVAGGIQVLPFVLFMGTAMSITAIPILGRMMLEMGITRTRLAAITISSAAVDDAAGWILLATVAAIARATLTGGEFNALLGLRMLAATVVFGVFMFLVVRPLLSRFFRWALRVGHGELGLNSLAVLLVVLFLCAVTTNLIGIFAIFGAFTLGAVLSGDHAFREAVNRRLRDFVTVFFLPVFFAYTGLRTYVDTVDSLTLWVFAAALSGTAILGKFGGCSLAAWMGGMKPHEAACIGVLMNTRALMELIVINEGKNLGVIPDSVFCMLVLMALLTTFMTTPLLLVLMRGTELEEPIRRSGFLGPAQPAAPKTEDRLATRA